MKEFVYKIILVTLIICCILSLASCTGSDASQIVKIIDIPLTNEEYVFVCKKGNLALSQSFDAFLSEIKNNGEFDLLVSKYFEGKGKKMGYTVTTESVENTPQNLIVATNCPFSPFEYRGDDGLIYGLDIEIAAAYAEANDLELIIKDIGFGEIFTQIDSGYADIGMAGITATPDRVENYEFTSGYYKASQKLIVMSQNTDFDKCSDVANVEAILSSLENCAVGYQNATTGSLYVNGDEDWGFVGFDNITGKAYETALLAVSDLVNGNLYAVILDEAPADSVVSAANAQGGLNIIAKLENFIDTLSNPHYLSVLFQGLFNTVKVAIIGLLLGILVGTLIAIVKVAPKYKLIYRVLDKICSFYTLIFRGTPIVAQLLIAYYVIIPSIGVKVEALTVGMIVFGLNSGAYVSEIMRGGLNSVDKGQIEAGRALGLTYATTMTKIVVPQAIKNILPTLGNEFISLIKETSVLSFIAVYDLYKALYDIGMVKYEYMIPYLTMGVIYIILVLIISLVIKIIERRFAKSDRN